VRGTEAVRQFRAAVVQVRVRVIVATAFGLALLSGCASQPRTLYYWGDYQGEVYAYLKEPGGGDIAQQIETLEEGARKAAAGNQALPPGYHAQLGMLYYTQGDIDRAAEQLALEKVAYPESTVFIDRLLAKFRKNQ
jgi:hypothetical protein